MASKDYSIQISINAVSNFSKISKELDGKLTKLDSSLKRINTTAKKNTATFKQLDGALSRLAFVALPAFGLAMGSILKEGIKFDAAIHDFSALTGIMGGRLDFLTEKAIELSKQWGYSATDVIKGFKRIASNKSEFIEIAGAIEHVGEAAAVLARASGDVLSFAQAGEVLTQTMNQMDMGLGDTDRIINTFALGAKLGSFEIGSLTQSLSRAGGMMKATGLEFEDAMSAIMVGSRLGLTGEMVGTQAKTLLGRLGMVDDAFNPLTDGFDQALEYMNRAGMSPGELSKLFGLESFQLGQALIDNKDMFERWRNELLEGQDTAYEQASENMASYQARIEVIGSKINAIKISWFNDESSQRKLDKLLDSIESFIDQSTIGARLLADSLKLLGMATVFTLAVFGAFKFYKAILLVNKGLIAVGLTAKKLITPITTLFIKSDRLWLHLNKIGSMSGLRILAVLGKVSVLITSIFYGVRGVYRIFTSMGTILEDAFADKDWTAVGQVIGTSLFAGLRIGFLDLAESYAGLLTMGWKQVGSWVMGNDFDPVGNFFDDKRAGVRTLNETIYRDIRERAVRRQFIQHMGIQDAIDAGEVTVLLKVDQSGSIVPSIEETKGPVKAEVDTGMSTYDLYQNGPRGGGLGFGFPQ